jgi:Zn finger protein HypA/HybF involved in hydrogenase expression
MKKDAKGHIEIEVKCLNCIWNGTVQAEKKDHFLHWECPRCGSRYCATTPLRVEESERRMTDGLKAA